MGGSEWLGLTNNEEHWKKLVFMHQASLYEFQGELKFGTEDKHWQ